MLPSPTPALMLLLADLRERFGAEHAACSRHMQGMIRRLGNETATVECGESLPEAYAAEHEAKETLAALCAICSIRSRCEGPVGRTFTPLDPGYSLRRQ